MALTSERIHELAEKETADILKKGKSMIRDLKKHNSTLKRDLKLMTTNNKAMEKLVEVLEERVKKLTDDVNKNYVYSFEDGGWIEKGAMKKRKARIKSYKKADILDINEQLMEILRMIKKHRGKLK